MSDALGFVARRDANIEELRVADELVRRRGKRPLSVNERRAVRAVYDVGVRCKRCGDGTHRPEREREPYLCELCARELGDYDRAAAPQEVWFCELLEKRGIPLSYEV